MKKNYGLSSAIGMVTLAISANSGAQMFKPSRTEQTKAGAEYAIKIRKENKILPDNDPRVVLLRQLGEKLLATRSPSDLKRESAYKFTFDVIDSKEVNAFAVPGGPMFFFTGLIDKMTTVDELAGVLGHEIIHIRREHWASAVNSQQERQAGIMILGTIFGASRQTMNTALLVNQFGFDLPAGRGQEKESDTFGFDTVVKAGYNPEGMVKVFQMFQTLKGKNAPPEFLSTHPDDKDRINRLQARIKDFQKKKLLPPVLGKLTPLPFETAAMKAERDKSGIRVTSPNNVRAGGTPKK